MRRNPAPIPDGAGSGGYEEVVPYDPSEIDFVVAYVMPCDAWFVIPVEAIAGRKTGKRACRGILGAGSWGDIGERGD